MAKAFTPEQRLAVECTGEHQVVTAGAGSGKTTVLVGRYLNLINPLRPGGVLAEPGQVVALTFTSKAAREMQERVRREVQARADGANEAERPAWLALRESLADGLITTFHSFCGSIVRVHPVEAGTDPQAAVIPQAEAWQRLDEAINRAMTDEFAGDPWLANLVARWGTSHFRESVADALRSVRGAGRSFLDLAPPAAVPDGVPALSGLTEAVLSAAAGVASTECRTDRGKRLLGDFRVAYPALESALATLQGQLDPAATESAVETVQRVAAGLPGNCEKALKETGSAFKGEVCALIEAVAERQGRAYLASIHKVALLAERYYREDKTQAGALDYEDLIVLARAILRGYPGILAAYRAKYRYFLVDEFQDTDYLQDEIISLLTGEWINDDPAGIAPGSVTGKAPQEQRLFVVGDPKQSIYRFRHAEVRLFEDRRTAYESQAGEGERRAVSMADNFRTRSQVLDFVNSVFGALMADAPGQVGYVPLMPRRKTRGRLPGVELLTAEAADLSTDGAVEVEAAQVAAFIKNLVGEGEAETARIRAAISSSGRDHVARCEEDLERRIATAAGRRLLGRGRPVAFASVEGAKGERPRPVRYGDIAILLRSRTKQSLFEEALASAGVPYCVLSGNGFYAKQEVLDLLALLRTVEDPSDMVSLFAALRSPLFGVADETLLRLVQECGDLSAGLASAGLARAGAGISRVGQAAARAWDVISRARRLSSRMPAHQLIDMLLTQTAYEGALLAQPFGAQRLANVRKLRDLAVSAAEAGMSGLTDFLVHIDLLASAADENEAPLAIQGGNAVQIMTIHAAKGLEFPLVIAADTARTGKPPETSTFKLMYHLRHGLGLRFAWAQDGRKTRSFQLACEEDDLCERAESVRLLYVALTRARDHLIISGFDAGTGGDVTGSGARGKQSWFAQLKEVLEAPERSGLWRPALAQVPEPAPEPVPEPKSEHKREPKREPESELEPKLEPKPSEQGESDRGALNLAGRSLARYSVSEVMSFAICPRRYFYQYRLRVPPVTDDLFIDWQRPEEVPVSAGQMAVEAGDGEAEVQSPRRAPADLVGTALHWVIEQVGGGPGAGAQGPADGELIEKAVARFVSRLPGIPGDPEVTEGLRTNLRRLLATYQRTFARIGGGEGERVLSEVPLLVSPEPGLVITGIADRLVYLTETEVRMLDFKTNAVPAGLVAGVAERYRLQLPLYTMALQAAGLSVREALLVFLWPGVSHACDIGPAALGAARGEIVSLCREMETGTEFPHRRGEACRHCGYRAFCATGTGA